MNITSRNSKCGIAYDDPIVEMWIDLPSGRRLRFADFQEGPYDTEGEVLLSVAVRKLEIVSMLLELGVPCPGLEIAPGKYSGCDQSGEDCPVCGPQMA